MVSKQAKDRKKRFLENKTAAGGISALIDNSILRPWRVYFNQEGEIMCFTKEEGMAIQPDWLTHDFTPEQIQVLKEKDLSKFLVKKDPDVDNRYTIEIKPIETVYINADDDFLYKIPEKKLYDIQVKITVSTMVIKLSKKIKKKYKDVYPISATVNGSRLLKFYITAKDDPHDMYHYSIVSLADLLSKEEVIIELEHDMRDYDVFTNKLFDVYARA